MDKNVIKKYAVWARRELIERVSQRAMVYGISAEDSGDPSSESVNGKLLSPIERRQRQDLIRNIKEKGYEQVMEEVAYTWFNRFAALRFMEVNGYLPSHIRVFTNDAGEFKPQILAEAIHLELDGLDMNRVYELESANKSEELFKYLLIVQCNALNSILPGMFQRIDDYTELLLPDYLLREGSVLEQLITAIPEEDWLDQVQVIGWLYQYYISEKKDAVFAALKKKVKITKENIPAATQLFTPDWIVHYMVENSLGRLYINKRLTEGVFADGRGLDEMTWEEAEEERISKEQIIAEQMGWKYYLPEAKQDPEVREQLDIINQQYISLKPEEIRVIDPCMGSGHILCVLFDVLVRIYEDYGYTAREAAVKIVENNLWGLDIDERAAQLSYFAVMMKARQYDRRFFTRKVQPHVYAIEESNGITSAPMHDMGLHLSQEEYGEAVKQAMRLVEDMHDAKEYGSIIHVTPCDWDLLRCFAVPKEEEGQLHLDIHGEIEASARLQNLIDIGETLTQKYDVVVTNPPYRGISDVGAKLQSFVQNAYPDSCTDLSTVFMEQCLKMANHAGIVSMINIPVWMTLAGYDNLRKKVLETAAIINALDLGRGMFGSDFGTVSFALRNTVLLNYKALYKKFYKRKVEVESEESKHSKFFGRTADYVVKQSLYTEIPKSMFAYSSALALTRLFKHPERISNYATVFEGLKTRDKERFLRLWFEVSNNKWKKYAKGGAFRRWYGNTDYVVNWGENGDEVRAFKKSSGANFAHYFEPAITYTAMTMSSFTGRYIDDQLFGGGGGGITNSQHIEFLLGFVNSTVFNMLISSMKSTVNFEVGQIGSIPILLDSIQEERIIDLVRKCVRISREDWDSFEISWDFQEHPFISSAQCAVRTGEAITIKQAFEEWQGVAEGRFYTLKENEEELNRIFIDIYGLDGELTPDVDEKDVTVRKADLQRDVRGFISYAVGCMFGRYSLGVPGLTYVGGEWDASKYHQFQPDKDAIIPICDDEYFEDDIVGRFVKFVEVAFGKEILEENLRFVADALGGKGSSREVIRNYFINDFYADHLKVYQKHPIYWLFDSGKKNGFKCLIYMHRYQPDTIARIRTDYVHEQQSRYRTAIADLEQRVNNASSSERVKISKQLTKVRAQDEELRIYEEKIHHLADQMIKIDLDDGVKHNYALFQDVLAKIK